jgi:hypothetical protein
VNASGLVTAVANGSASIVASAGGQSGSVSVQVAQKVASVSVQAPTGALDALGATMQLTAVGRDAKENVVAGASFAWSSSAANVTTVDANGLVTAVGNGAAKISASADGKSGSADIKVAQRIASISVAPGADTLEALGATVQLNAVAKDANGNIINGPALTWSSSAASVVSVSASGVASAVSNGAATVSAIAGPVAGGVNLLVAQRVASVGISPADATLAPGATQQFSADAQDANGNPVAVKFLWVSSNHNVAIIDQNGVATGVNGGSVSITAAGGGVPASAALTVSAAPEPPPPPSATQLGFTVQPANAMVGAALTPAIEVEVRDAQGNRVTSARNAVRLIIGTNAGGGNLSGTNAVNAVNGIASFPGLRLDQPGTGYTLVATADNENLARATSAPFDIAPRPAATQLAFSVQPTNTMAGQAISPAVQVEIRDASGARVWSSREAVAIEISRNPGGGTLAGTRTVNAVNGVASFPGLSIDNGGKGYQLAATSGKLTAASSAAFDVAPRPVATHLVFTVQPATARPGHAISPAIQVEIRDANRQLVPTARDAVTLLIQANPAGGTLAGTRTVNAVNGIATFPGLSIDKIGHDYKLAASSGALAAAISEEFDIEPRTILLTNTDWVQYEPAKPDAEASNLEASLEFLGFDVDGFRETDGEHLEILLRETDVMAIPELRANLGGALQLGARAAIVNFVERGGTLMVFAGANSGNARVFMNTVFGYAAVPTSGVAHNDLNEVNAAGTPFEGAADLLRKNTNTSAITERSLPEGAKTIYGASECVFVDCRIATVLAVIPRSAGRIIFFGWGWDNAHPKGTEDGGWLDLLRRAMLY